MVNLCKLEMDCNSPYTYPKYYNTSSVLRGVSHMVATQRKCVFWWKCH